MTTSQPLININSTNLLADRLVLIVIINYNSESDTQRLLSEIASSSNLSQLKIKVIIVNNSNNGRFTLTSIQPFPFEIHVLNPPHNLGFSGGLEFALKIQPYGKPEYLWFLNPDLHLEPENLFALVSALERDPSLDAVGGRIFQSDSKIKIWGTLGWIDPYFGRVGMKDWKSNSPIPKWSYLPGCSPMIRYNSYVHHGGYSTEYFLYFEETEFFVRLLNAGGKVRIFPKIHFVHPSQSSVDGLPKEHYIFHFNRSRILFFKRNTKIPIFLVLFSCLLGFLRHQCLPFIKRGKIFNFKFWRIFKIFFQAIADSNSNERLVP